jgi:hypothetical protein
VFPVRRNEGNVRVVIPLVIACQRAYSQAPSLLKTMAAPKHNPRYIITASEIGEFVYCTKAWQLKRDGAEADSPALAEGAAFHTQHGAGVAQSARLQHTAKRLLLLAFVLLIGMILLWLARE